MIKHLPYKTKQFLVVLLKLTIVVGAFYFIYHKLTQNDALKFGHFITMLEENNSFSIEMVLFLIVLSVFNYYYEILKWKTLVSSITSISFKNASEQSLGALTASLLTPNRIGDYGAKALYYQKSLRKRIMLLNLIGNMMQMTTTLIFGSIGFFIFAYNYSLELEVVKISLSILAFSLILIATYYFLKKIQFKVKGFSLEKIRTFVKGIPFEIKIKTFQLSVIRYLIFSFQFYFLLQIFNVNIDYFTAMMGITSMYLLASMIPSIFMFDVFIKGGVAVYLFSIIGVNDVTILSIITVMWLLNFVLPSLIGSYYILNFNHLKVRQPAA